MRVKPLHALPAFRQQRRILLGNGFEVAFPYERSIGPMRPDRRPQTRPQTALIEERPLEGIQRPSHASFLPQRGEAFRVGAEVGGQEFLHAHGAVTAGLPESRITESGPPEAVAIVEKIQIAVAAPVDVGIGQHLGIPAAFGKIDAGTLI